MTSWEWAEENPFISARAVARLMREHSITPEDREKFAVEVPPESDGLFDSGAVLAWLGY